MKNLFNSNKLVAMVRVKNGILFVNEWLEVMEKLADEIVVVDNGSTDGTLEILRSNQKVVEIAQTEDFDEGRDKILLYELARKRKPDWCIWLDIDEIFEKRITRAIIEEMMKSTKYTKFVFRLFHFAKDYKHVFFYFKPFGYNFGYPRTMWKEHPSGYFNNLKIHNGGIQGIDGNLKKTDFRIKHLGYVDMQYVEKKTHNYITVDPDRKELYLKHFAKTPGFIYKWHEYEEKPFIVSLQLFFYNSIHYSLKSGRKILKFIK